MANSVKTWVSVLKHPGAWSLFRATYEGGRVIFHQLSSIRTCKLGAKLIGFRSVLPISSTNKDKEFLRAGHRLKLFENFYCKTFLIFAAKIKMSDNILRLERLYALKRLESFVDSRRRPTMASLAYLQA